EIEDGQYKDSIDKRILFLEKLEENRLQVVDRIKEHQLKVNKFFDKKAKAREFKVGDFILLWDKRREPKGSHGKFDSLWLGPFEIHEAC
ncbi:hypothetical protein KI387_001236, partial [Taxus chinensis]